MTASLTLEGVSHDYGDGPVLRSVDVAVAAGEVHALLGMNGAGKSTLVHIGAGMLAPTSGRILIDGTPVRFVRPSDALARGVVLLAQEVDRALVADASVHENLTAGMLRAGRARFYSPRRNRARARGILQRYGVDIDVDRRVRDLSLYEKQALSLVRAAAADARYLFLDEPTSSFDRTETERFYGIVRALTSDGIGIVFISHRLAEVFEIADRITVLRGGEVALHAARAETTPDDVVTAITGGLVLPGGRRADTSGEPAFDAQIELGRGREPIALSLRAGTITSVFGPLGSGKTTLGEGLFGLRGEYRGMIAGRSVRVHSPVAARRAGIALIPEERRTQALWLDESVGTHFSLGFRGLIRRRRERARAAELIASYRVEPPMTAQRVRRLSGGNQQKVAIGKWDGLGPHHLVILDEPMKGVDVAAREAIFASIEALADAGAAVLYLTQEPDEALRIADRVLVLGRRGLVLDRPRDDVDVVDLMLDDESIARTPYDGDAA